MQAAALAAEPCATDEHPLAGQRRARSRALGLVHMSDPTWSVSAISPRAPAGSVPVPSTLSSSPDARRGNRRDKRRGPRNALDNKGLGVLL